MRRFDPIDPRFRREPLRYLWQVALAALALFLILWIEHTFARVVIIAAVGSTAFVLFIMPESEQAGLAHVFGGHALALATGSLATLLDTESAFMFALGGSLAVGGALFGMAALNMEHAPAAGTALGIVASGTEVRLVVFLAITIAALTAIHLALRPWLRNLY